MTLPSARVTARTAQGLANGGLPQGAAGGRSVQIASHAQHRRPLCRKIGLNGQGCARRRIAR